jgi:uncharacterized protein (DUF4415 family)
MNADDSRNTTETDWARLEVMTDDEIDYSDIPPLPDAFFAHARAVDPGSPDAAVVHVDSDVLAWFRHRGTDYERLINGVLRRYVDAHAEQ